MDDEFERKRAMEKSLAAKWKLEMDDATQKGLKASAQADRFQPEAPAGRGLNDHYLNDEVLKARHAARGADADIARQIQAREDAIVNADLPDLVNEDGTVVANEL